MYRADRKKNHIKVSLMEKLLSHIENSAKNIDPTMYKKVVSVVEKQKNINV